MILVLLSLGAGNLYTGFDSVRVQIRNTLNSFEEKLTACLPSAPELSELYLSWKQEYLNLISLNTLHTRIDVLSTGITHGSDRNFKESCDEMSSLLNLWLSNDSFSAMEKRLRSILNIKEEILVLIDTEDETLQRLPWHLWNFWQDYPQAEIGLSACEYTCVSQSNIKGNQVRILAVLGNGEGIDIKGDRSLLEGLANVEIQFLVEPSPETLNATLWDEKGWDILFFAGHSNTEQQQGFLNINSSSLGNINISQFRFALKKACSNGLQLAIFNSCDGIGLATNIAELNIPQTIVMREVVPDQVAQEFLKLLLPSYATGNSLISALRQTRERLHSLEPKFLCASWLPLLYQNPSAKQKLWRELGRPLIVTDETPYLGLSTFSEKEAIFFKGRENLTEQLYRAVMAKPLTAVVGASGSGKSSLVFAGLIPHLRQQGNWHIIDFRPGVDPISSLVDALSEVLVTDLTVSLQSQLNQWFAQHKTPNSKKLLLIVDQFEEIYSLCEEVQQREDFLNQLLDALKNLANLKVVLTLRADFIQDAITFRPLAEALQYADLKVSPMNLHELKEAIVKPAELMGVTFEEGLIERIIAEVKNEPSNLALLEFTLRQLWEKRQKQQLTHQAYNELGGLRQALSLYAQRIYHQLSTQEKKIARQIFLALVRVNEESEHNRRQVDKKDLIEPGNSLNELVLNKLAQAKLVVISCLEAEHNSKVVVNLAHEALINHWELLHDWVEENRDRLRFAQRLEIDVKHWVERGQPKSREFLLQGLRLKETKHFLDCYGQEISLSANVRQFISSSINQLNRSRIIRWVGVSSLTLGIATGLFLLGFARYHKYWKGTIERVQTVDFNILSHLLPYKLSSAMLKQDEREIQKIINSNYGLFGIVVTDCQGEDKECLKQQIVYSTRSKRDWKQNLTTEDLINHPYDILRDPPPFATENIYRNPRQVDRVSTGKVNQGKIIGRVYYIRQKPPSFTDSLFHSLF